MMRERNICRCSHFFEKSLRNTSDRRSFAVQGSKPHYAPDRPFKLENIKLDLDVSPEQKVLEGTITHTVTAVLPEQQWMRLDQIGLSIKKVTVKDQNVDFYTSGNTLNIQLPFTPTPGESFSFSVQYRLEKSRRGMFFTGPDAEYPDKPFQVWTQGQDEDSRYWFPTFDYPNQKATTEVLVTVPQGYTAVSNGALISQKTKGDKSFFHYRLGTPHVTYLITLVVAKFSQWQDQGPRGLPVQYFVAPGREADGKRAFGNTPQMIEAFEKKTGIPFPYEKYSQVAVQDFIFGGMENTSATTQTDLTLHDARAHLDFSSDPLVSHELAHQWFGDLVTCRDWSHGWLNEGFATFLERVWIECDTGPQGGGEEAKYYSYQDLKEYLADDLHSYRRPIVCNTYIEPINLFDTHLYQKGGLVLNLLRYVLGDALFWKSVNLYLSRHQGQNVETIDLIRAIEDTTGRNLRRFFDEWVFGEGYPEFEVGYQWNPDKKMAEWNIEQKQASSGGKVFHLPVVLEMILDDGTEVRHRIDLEEARERLFFSTAGKPVRVRFDSGFNIPKTLKFPRPKELLINQLFHDKDCMGRIEAAQELGKIADLEIVAALKKALTTDSFWAVQYECAKTLGQLRLEGAHEALIEGLKVAHPKARRSVVQALIHFKNPKAIEALAPLAQKDPSYFVESDALYSWAVAKIRTAVFAGSKSSSKELGKELDEVKQKLNSKLEVSSYREVIRCQALKAFAEFPGIEKGDHSEILRTLCDWTSRGKPLDARMAAVRALGVILQKSSLTVKNSILELFSHLADEDNFRLRVQLVAAMGDSAMAETIPILQKIRTTDLDGRVTRAALVSVDRMMRGSDGSLPESVVALKDALDRLEEDYKKLKTKVEEEAGQKK